MFAIYFEDFHNLTNIFGLIYFFDLNLLKEAILRQARYKSHIAAFV